MFDDEDFNLFDDKQVEKLNASDKPEDTTDDQATDTTDQSSTDTSVSEDTKSDSEGADDTSSDTSDGEESSETESTDGAEVAPAEAPVDQEKEKFATKDDIRAALAEQEAIKESQQTVRKSLRSELRGELFPDGIDVDLQIQDSEGGVITGPSQIAGKLINPSTQELFTYEEAKDYWDNAQRHIDKTVEEREQLVDRYAENNQSFFEGSQIVENKYGAFMKANPDVAKQLLDNYLKTAKITKSGYITDMPLDVVSYYDTAMRPLASVASQLELRRQGEEAQKATETAKNKQSDRADLPVNSNTTPPTKKDELSSAFDRYFGGK